MRSAQQHCALNLSAVYTPTRLKHSGVTLPQGSNEAQRRQQPPTFATPSRSHLRRTIGSPLGIDSASSSYSHNHQHDLSSSLLHNNTNITSITASLQPQHTPTKSHTSKKEATQRR